MLLFIVLAYGVLNSVLTVTSRANITSDFNIHFLTENNLITENNVTKKGITLVNYASSTSQNTVYNTSVTSKAADMEAGTGVNMQTPTEANFTAILQKPTDYAIFTAIAKNYGTITGKISEVTIISTPSTELASWLSENGGTWSDYFEITTDAAINTVLTPGQEYQFTVIVRYKDSARKLPQGALNNTIVITFAQDNGQTYDNQGNSIVYDDEEDSCFISVLPGEINYYDTSKEGCGTTITIPDNLRLKTSPVTSVSFNNQICQLYADYLKPRNSEQTNQEFCVALQNQISGMSTNDLFASYLSAFVTPVFGEPTGDYNLITTIGASSFQTRNISSIALSSEITEIKDAAFAGNSLTNINLPSGLVTIGNYAFILNGIGSLSLPASLETIGESAFQNNRLTGTLTIPSGVQTIGKAAFLADEDSQYKITGLNLSNATSLTYIGDYTFEYQNISSVDFSNITNLQYLSGFNGNSIASLTIPNTVTTLGRAAFAYNRLTGTITIPSSVQKIDEYAFDNYNYSNYEITGINFSNATNLAYIGSFAFQYQAISSLDLSALNNLTHIGLLAFSNQATTNNDRTLQSINASNKTKAQYDAISENKKWYDDDHSNFHITYSDQCVGNGC